MYGIFTNIWVIHGVNVGKYSIHGASGKVGSIFDWFHFHVYAVCSCLLHVTCSGVFSLSSGEAHLPRANDETLKIPKMCEMISSGSWDSDRTCL